MHVNSKSLNAKDAKDTRRKPERDIFSGLISLFLGDLGGLGGLGG